MAAYEVLLLNTAVPQIQAAQSGDTYVVPRDIAFSAVALLANGTNSAPSLTFSSDTDTGIFRPTTNQLGFATAGVQAMTLDASGNLVVGGTTALRKITSAGTSGELALLGTGADGTEDALIGRISSQTRTSGSAATSSFASIEFRTGGFPWYQTGFIRFLTNSADGTGSAGTERARIASGGYFKASNDGTYLASTGPYHEIRQTASGNNTLQVSNNAADPYGVVIAYTGASPNGTANYFLYCRDSGPTVRAEIRSDGGLANYQANNANLSDQRVKKDIVAAPSYWNKIKGIEIVHFKYKDQTHDDSNVGVIAQQVEQVAPEFVDQDGWGETPEDGVPLKSIYTSDMYHAAIKALQEAMARIEQLEAKVAALEGV